MKRCILSVEDDQDAIFFLELAFKKAAIVQPLVTLDDGEKAINYVLGVGAFANRELHPLPSLILLDIKMPKKSGFEVLELIRKTHAIETLPVVMLTSSAHPDDILRSRELGADHFLVKPPDIEKLAQMIKMVYDRWVGPQLNGMTKGGPLKDDTGSLHLHH
jgi:DNA-binding response OmpR family regulator